MILLATSWHLPFPSVCIATASEAFERCFVLGSFLGVAVFHANCHVSDALHLMLADDEQQKKKDYDG